MSITKTAKRALRSSKRKEAVNKKIIAQLEVAMRVAKRSLKKKDIANVISLSDRASKKRVLHKNKAARIKSKFHLLQKTKKSSS
jgi:ribosomal protein S20